MVEFIGGAVASIVVLTAITHPRSKINKRLPEKKIKNLQVFPRISISARNRVFHLHHWVLLTPAYLLVANASKGVLSADIVQGLFLGGIMQGLMFKDRFRFIFRRDEYHHIKNSHLHIPLLSSSLKKIIN